MVRKPAATASKPATVNGAGLAKPRNASSGEITPHSVTTIRPNMKTRSVGTLRRNCSTTKTKIVTPTAM